MSGSGGGELMDLNRGSDPPDDETFKILISSDNHLGVYDTNPRRENDSFNTFEEILQLGKDEGVDFVLLGGDLFHENKPSPASFQRAVDILQKHCLGPRSVKFEYLGDPKLDFHGQEEPCVNYYNPNINIDLPIFTTHGNHDDPIGIKKTSVIDHLAAANLVNHFGTVKDLSNIEIRPVLFRKGQTLLALYGLGYLKDQRLYRLMKDSKVKFLRPAENQDSWYNIFVIHQNRVPHGTTNYIPENFIPGFIDLVVWGHEHECKPDLDQLNNTTLSDSKCTMVLQPGSSVATQLQPGEAVHKHAVILTLFKRNFKVDKFPLKTVRPFILTNILSSDILKGKPMNSNMEKVIQSYLETRVNTLIREANDMLTGHEMQPIEPLLRIRLFHQDDIGSFHPSRFNQQFQNRIANEDIVILSKMTTKSGGFSSDINLDDIEEMIMEADEEIDIGSHVEEIVERHFREERSKGERGNFLRILSEKGLSEGIRAAAEKDDQEAIALIIESQISKTMEYLESKKVMDDDSITLEIAALGEARSANSDREVTEARKQLEERDRTRAKGRRKPSAEQESYDSEEDAAIGDSEDEEAHIAVPAASTRGRGRGRGRGSRGSPSAPRGRGRGRGRGSAQKTATNMLPVRVKNRGHSSSVVQFDDQSDDDY